MELEMYAYTTTADIPAVDFDETDDCADLFYWRKHPNLHGWMEALYRSKGGTGEDFNVSPVRLEPADLDALEAPSRPTNSPSPRDSSSASPGPKIEQDDLAFIQQARAALNNGLNVFYTSWW